MDDDLEKYAVVTDSPVEKVAGAAPVLPACPWCGGVCEVHGMVRKCPSHGTAPFEPKERIDGKEGR